MIDWLLNILYNIGMFMLLLLFIFGALIHLKVKAEHTPEHANYMMLQELRKLNRHQQEQREREERAQIQAQREEIEQLLQTSKQLLAQEPQKPGFWDRVNMKLERENQRMAAWHQRLDEQAAERKAKRLAKKSKTQPATVMPPPLPLPQKEVKKEEKEEEEDDIYRKFFDADNALSWQISELEDMIEAGVTGKLPKTKIGAALTALEDKLPANFWGELSAFKAELVAIDHHVLLADLEERELEYTQMKQLVEALLPSESVKAQYSRSLATPPPLPPLS